MGTPTSFSLIQHKPSPKLEQLYPAIIKGFPNTGININAEHQVLWGLIGDNYQRMIPNKFTFCDMPYYGRLQGEDYENSFWRWCYNGFHDNRKLDVPQDRFEDWNVEVKPYINEGDFILICPSSETMTRAMFGITQDRWIQNIYDKLKPLTNKPIRVRYKPRKNGKSGPQVETISMKEELQDCHALITSASLTSVEALLEGIPVFTDAPQHCPAAWASNTDFTKINTPDKLNREELLYNLAYKQYSISEFRNGTAYEYIDRYIYN